MYIAPCYYASTPWLQRWVGGTGKPPLKSRHGWVTASNKRWWAWLLMHVLILRNLSERPLGPILIQWPVAVASRVANGNTAFKWKLRYNWLIRLVTASHHCCNKESSSAEKAVWGFHLNGALQWLHNERDGVPNHHPRDYLLNCLFNAQI